MSPTTFTFKTLLNNLSDTSPAVWEYMWHALVCADGFPAGMTAEATLTDDRITVKGGGVDVLVTQGAIAKAHILPERQSIWSIKSGMTALSKSTLEDEIYESKHPDLVATWRNEWRCVCCVCASASRKQHTALTKAANALCAREGLLSDGITVLFDDHLRRALMYCPAALQRFCPSLGLSVVIRHEQWVQLKTNRFNVGVKYVDFDDRARVVEA